MSDFQQYDKICVLGNSLCLSFGDSRLAEQSSTTTLHYDK